MNAPHFTVNTTLPDSKQRHGGALRLCSRRGQRPRATTPGVLRARTGDALCGTEPPWRRQPGGAAPAASFPRIRIQAAAYQRRPGARRRRQRVCAHDASGCSERAASRSFLLRKSGRRAFQKLWASAQDSRGTRFELETLRG